MGKPYTVRGISLMGGVTVTEVEKRRNLLKDLDRTFAGFEQNEDLVKGLDTFGEQAHNIISSSRARDAFDISKEKKEVAEQYGNHAFGQSCLLATRLVESGVRFVSLSLGGWDTHKRQFHPIEERQIGRP